MGNADDVTMEETAEEGDPEEIEHLVSVLLNDGSKIEFDRMLNKDVRVCHGEKCVVLPKASGQVTFDFLALLEPFGKIEEPPEQNEND